MAPPCEARAGYPIRLTNSESVSSTPFPRQVLVVCDRELRTHARSLVRAASTYQSIEWCFASEFEARAQKGTGTRNIFIGDSKYASFLRGLAKPTARKHGAVWALYKQHALIYTEDVIVDVRATLPHIKRQLEDLKTEAQYQAESVSYHEGIIEGPLVAHEYFKAVENHPALKLDDDLTRERDVKRAFVDHQYVLALSWFLMEGWDQLIAGPQSNEF